MDFIIKTSVKHRCAALNQGATRVIDLGYPLNIGICLHNLEDAFVKLTEPKEVSIL